MTFEEYLAQLLAGEPQDDLSMEDSLFNMFLLYEQQRQAMNGEDDLHRLAMEVAARSRQRSDPHLHEGGMNPGLMPANMRPGK